MKGLTEHDIAEFYVEAEIHDFSSKDQILATGRKAAQAIMQFDPAVPTAVKAAVEKKQDAKIGNWIVKHDGGGFTVICQLVSNWEHNEK